MSIIKTIKFDLPIDGVKIKSLEELRDHFTVEILDLYNSGILIKWLQSRNLTEELQAVRELTAHSDVRFTMMKKLCEIFKIEADDLLISLSVGESAEKINKNFSDLKSKYKHMIRDEVNRENHDWYEDMVNKIDYVVYRAIRLSVLFQTSQCWSNPELKVKSGDAVGQDEYMASGESPFVSGIFDCKIGNSKEISSGIPYGWFLYSGSVSEYDKKEEYSWLKESRLSFFISIIEQRKKSLLLLASGFSNDIFKNMLLSRVDDLTNIIENLKYFEQERASEGQVRYDGYKEKTLNDSINKLDVNVKKLIFHNISYKSEKILEHPLKGISGFERLV